MGIKRRIFEVIQIGKKEDLISRLFDIFIVTIIIINLAGTMASTFDELKPYENVLNAIETITVIIFSIEYILRLWTSDLLYTGNSKAKALIKYIFSFYGLIDLLTIIPFYLPFVFPSGAVAFRIFRVIRIFRLFKINAQYDAYNVIIDVIKDKKSQILSSIFIIIILLMASSLCMYSLEHDAQPEQFKNAFSGIWWSVSTMLTVGYGDIYPVTIAGKIMAIIISFLGVGIVAIPTGIISAGFVEHYAYVKKTSEEGIKHGLGNIVIAIDESHRWFNKTVKELKLVDGLVVAAICHDEEIYPPRSDMKLGTGDKVVLTDCMQDWTLDYSLSGLDIAESNGWVGSKIKELDISRLERITMIKRGEHYSIPDGDYVIKPGDHVVVVRMMNNY